MKSFFPEVLGGGIMSHLHPRHRQTVEVVDKGSPGSAEAMLDPGDVLFIPAFWLHTATAESDSASLSLCSSSAAEVAAMAIESFPVSFDLSLVTNLMFGVLNFISKCWYSTLGDCEPPLYCPASCLVVHGSCRWSWIGLQDGRQRCAHSIQPRESIS